MKEKTESTISQNVAINTSKAVSPGSSVIDDRLLPHYKELCNLLYESFTIQSIYAAAKAGIADVLSSGPKSADDIAEATGNNPDAIYRLMRALAGIGIFRETSARMFELTPKAELLQENHPTSLRPLTLVVGDPTWREPWGNIMHSLKTGEEAFKYTFNKGIFDYGKEHEDVIMLYQRLLTIFSILNCPVIAASYPFSEFHKVIDIGGGQGSLLAHILRQHPSVKGVLFDLPEVVQGPNEIGSDIAQRCEIVGGNFFKEVPEGGDIYIIQQVIHDWNDELAVNILTNCRKVMTDNARLLVVDAVLAPGNDRDMNKFMDLHMLITTSGRERSEQEFRKLFQDAGLELTRIISTASILSFSIVEGKKS